MYGPFFVDNEFQTFLLSPGDEETPRPLNVSASGRCEKEDGGGGLEEGEGQTLCAGGQQCQPALTSPKSTAASKLKAEVTEK